MKCLKMLTIQRIPNESWKLFKFLILTYTENSAELLKCTFATKTNQPNYCFNFSWDLIVFFSIWYDAVLVLEQKQ